MQQLLSFLAVDPLQENWDASLQAAVSSVKGALRTLKMSISFQGDHTTPSRVQIQLQDAVGNDLAEQYYLRVRVVNNNGYLVATHATMSAYIGTLVETLTTGKDLILQSDASGLIEVTCTDATAETFQVCIGAPDLCPPFANFNNSQTVVHT